MPKYKIKITRTQQSGGRTSYLTENYGWHPDIEPKIFNSRQAAEYWRSILKPEDCFAILYTG